MQKKSKTHSTKNKKRNLTKPNKNPTESYFKKLWWCYWPSRTRSQSWCCLSLSCCKGAQWFLQEGPLQVLLGHPPFSEWLGLYPPKWGDSGRDTDNVWHTIIMNALSAFTWVLKYVLLCPSMHTKVCTYVDIICTKRAFTYTHTHTHTHTLTQTKN